MFGFATASIPKGSVAGCVVERRARPVLGRAVPAPHRLGQDDRLLLRQLRRLILHHLVPVLPDGDLPPHAAEARRAWHGPGDRVDAQRLVWRPRIRPVGAARARFNAARKICLVAGLLGTSVIALAVLSPTVGMALLALSASYLSSTFAAASVWSLPADVAPAETSLASQSQIPRSRLTLFGMTLVAST